MTLEPGSLLNQRFRIEKLLGRGGFGAVYKAWDTVLESPCAIKESLDTSPQAESLFLREAKLLANLAHINLPRVRDFFSLPGQGQYLVMEFVEGQDLQQIRQEAKGPLPLSQVMPWFIQVCEALEYLHSQDPPVIHRDIKPANIKLTPEGRAILVDFGIAKFYRPHTLTTAGARAVTPGFSPPEQYGQGSTDVRSDVYALGATLYALLTGQDPPSSMDVVGGSFAAPTPAHKLNPLIPTEIGQAIERAMQLQPDNRFPTITEFKNAIVQAVSPEERLAAMQLVAQQRAAALAPVKRVVRGSVWLIGIGGILFGLLAIYLIFTNLEAIAGFFGASNRQSGRDTGGIVVEIAPSATPSPYLTPTPLAKMVLDGRGVYMVLIPAGPFEMGDKRGASGELPVHTVMLPDFYIDQFEVTNAQYMECVKAGRCQPPARPASNSVPDYFANPAFASYPVVNVSWSQALTYCAWRDARLPSEAEWEKAARGGLLGKLYPWGDQPPTCDTANFWGKDGGCFGDPVAANAFEPNGFEVYNMAGNVWEWVNDWYQADYYAQSPSDSPPGPINGTQRVLRGGSWYSNAESLRVFIRGMNVPDWSSNYVGFRCARSPSANFVASAVTPTPQPSHTPTYVRPTLTYTEPPKVAPTTEVPTITPTEKEPTKEKELPEKPPKEPQRTEKPGSP